MAAKKFGRKQEEGFQKRLSTLVYISMVFLIITGLPLARNNPHFQGLFSFGNTYSTTLTQHKKFRGAGKGKGYLEFLLESRTEERNR